MKTITYINSNGDTVLVDIMDNTIKAVYVFGVNILNRLTDKQVNYLWTVIEIDNQTTIAYCLQ